MIFRLAIRELIHTSPRLAVAFFIVLLGFIGPLFSSGLRTSVDAFLVDRSRQILSADLAVSALRPLKVEEVKLLEDALRPIRVAREVEFMTMGRGKDVATLVEVNAVDEEFPVFGVFDFKNAPERSNRSARELSGSERIAWVYPEVLAQLGLNVGDSVQLGRVTFKIEAVLNDGPGLSRGGGFAPRLYIGKKFVADTGLAEVGSQIFHRTYLQLPKSLSADKAAERVKEELKDPDIFLRTPNDSTGGIERFFSFFGLYLATVSMLVFALSWISAFYILQIFLQERLKNAAILMTFGASRAQAGILSFVQILALLLSALSVATLLVLAGVSLMPHLLGDLIPHGLVVKLSGTDFVRLFIVALVSAFAFTLPLFVRLYRMKLQDLLGENAMGAERLTRNQTILAYAPLAIVFVSLSAWLMDSWVNALQVTGGLVAAAMTGWLIARMGFRSLFAVVKSRPGLFRLVATNLSRSRFGMNLCFITLVLVSLVLNLMPHLLKSAVSEVEPLQGREIPSLFLFNIPEEAVEPLGGFVKAQNAEMRFLSPMILGRLMKVNGKPAENEQFQRFPVRMSYRSGRFASEKLLEGDEFSGLYDAEKQSVAELSIEYRWAERNGFKLGDEIEFDIQGVPVSGRITSLRRVRWTDFNPNFFIIFQPGVLDDAPKTWLANINFNGAEDEREKAKIRFQFEALRDFPDLSVIDIGRTLERGLSVARSVLGPIRAAAWLAVLMSFGVLFGVISHNLRMRDREIDIEKVLGADSRLIRNLITSEYLVMSTMAAVFGATAALVLTSVVTTRIFDIQTQIEWGALGFSVALTIALAGLLAYVSCTRVLNLRGTSKKL